MISIHALREEGDHWPYALRLRLIISIHALREEGDADPPHGAPDLRNFYPRPPRGGRRRQSPSRSASGRISIHALREEGDVRGYEADHHHDISIHALREEGDLSRTSRIRRTEYFYPRPPRGGRPFFSVALHPAQSDFYPRPPRGGRPMGDRAYIKFVIFLSTPSARRATWTGRRRNALCWYFYPRPPRGGRRRLSRRPTMSDVFLSTPSARRATSRS